jgi:hypothetical protein
MICEKNQARATPEIQSNLQRALFGTGLIAGSLNWDRYENIKEETQQILSPGKV